MKVTLENPRIIWKYQGIAGGGRKVHNFLKEKVCVQMSHANVNVRMQEAHLGPHHSHELA